MLSTMHDKRTAVVPIQEPEVCVIDSSESFKMDERVASPLHLRVKQAAKGVGWSEDSIAVAISDILGPYARKEWNLPVGSHKNPFWRLTRKLASPREVNKMLSKSLLLACTLGSAQLVRNLLQAGADPGTEPGKWGPLHSAAYGGNVEVMRALLEDCRVFVNGTEKKGNTALHLAAYKGNYEVMKVLLDNTETDVNAVNDTGCTALHIAGTAPLLGEVQANRYLQCISLLMRRADLKANRPDKSGFTALSHAIMYSRKEMAQAIMRDNGNHCLNVDTFLAGYYGRSIREAIQNTFHELVPDLPTPLQENSDSPANRLLASLQRGEFSTFQLLLNSSSVDVNHWYDEPYYSTITEIAIQLRNRIEFFKELLKAGANPNLINPITSLSLLHQTARRGNVEVLRCLLQVKGINVNTKDSEERTPLHCLSQVRCKSSIDCEGHQKSIGLLLGDSIPDMAPVSDLNAVTASGETPLHLAARMGDAGTVLTLLRSGADIMHRVAGLEPPLTYIDPAVLEGYLDDCVDSNDESPLHQDYMLAFDYRFLNPIIGNKPRKRKWFHDSEMPPLKFLSSKHRLVHLLHHPVISSFIMLKWQKVRCMYLMNFVFYCLFLASLTWYCLLRVNEGNRDGAKESKEEGNEVSEASANEQVTTESNVYTSSQEDKYVIPLSILSFFVSLLLIREMYQMFTSPKLYVKHSNNWLLWVVILSSLSVCMDGEITILPECESMSLLLAWTQFLVLIGGFPSLSIQLEMLKTVAGTFFTFIICYFPILIAFAISFYTMFKNNVPEENEFFYTNFGMSLLKVFIMFAGEFEASEIPFDSAPGVSQIVFTIFVFLISIVLLNLLNGLAVSDAQTIRKNAEVLSLRVRVNLISYMEKMSFGRFSYFSVLQNLPDKKFKLFPNKKNGRVEVHGLSEQNTLIPSKIIQEAVAVVNKRKEMCREKEKTTKNETSELHSKLAHIENYQMSMDRKLTKMQKQLDELFQLVLSSYGGD
ncbi:transient receptor potential cation channel protein painless-like [Periplaneta americana]|uniref:transient receptor potential cation channel protein painless-like n=1 Tax=Periplaneta americana TaxID=6978 RepID=UPI0037E70E38